MECMEAIENGIINSIYKNSRNGFVTIKYEMADQNIPVHKYLVLTLVIGRNTAISDQFGKRIGLRSLKEGMVLNARFSPNMTKSHPPKAAAHRITIVKENEASAIEEGRVLELEWFGSEYYYLLTGNPDSINKQMRYVIAGTTLLRDAQGNRIPLKALTAGSIVRIEQEAFQSKSIPPQTGALTVQIIRR